MEAGKGKWEHADKPKKARNVKCERRNEDSGPQWQTSAVEVEMLDVNSGTFARLCVCVCMCRQGCETVLKSTHILKFNTTHKT